MPEDKINPTIGKVSLDEYERHRAQKGFSLKELGKLEELRLSHKDFLDGLTSRLSSYRDARDAKLKGILETVEEKGYYCEASFSEDVPGLSILRLPLFFYMNLYSLTAELHKVQKDWVSRLGFDYIPTVYDVTKPKNHEFSIDWMEDISADTMSFREVISVSVYYRRSPCPPESSTFEIITREGDLRSGKIQGGQVWLCGEDEPVNWDCLNGFLLLPRA